MAHTRTFPTTLGVVDCTSIDELKPGDLFTEATGLNEENKLDVADLVETHCVWMRTDTKISKDVEAQAVSVESGHIRYFERDTKVIILHQRNMWEIWT